MQSIGDFWESVVFVYWEYNNYSFCHFFNEQDNQLMVKKLDAGKTKIALS